MSENITHMAVYEDSARLALHSPHVCAAFKETLEKHWEIGRLGSVTRSGDKSTVHLLNLARSKWKTRRPEDHIDERLAYLLGWRGHLAADRTFKPVYRQLNKEHYLKDLYGVNDCTIYHDVTIFREVYKSGKAHPFRESSLDYRLETHPAGQALPAHVLQDLCGAQIQRQLIELQSFLTDDSDFDAWLDLVFARLEPYTVELNRYADAYHNTDPEKLYRFIIRPNFYDREDPLIRLARGIQDGEIPQDIDIDAALSAADAGSQYAQALKLGHQFLAAASAYFEGRIDEATLRERSRIGKPHVPREMQVSPLPGAEELRNSSW